MSLLDLTFFNAIKGKMGYLAERQGVISTNIANANTPGYKSKDLVSPNFNQLMESKSQKLALSTTSGSHMTGSIAPGNRFASREKPDGLDTTPMGNNVVLEDEALKLTQTESQYKIAARMYKKMSALVITAVKSQ